MSYLGFCSGCLFRNWDSKYSVWQKKDRIDAVMFLSVVWGSQKPGTGIVRRRLHGPYRTGSGITDTLNNVRYCDILLRGALRHLRFIYFLACKGKLHLWTGLT
jgi:hypothetical protein